MTQELRQPYNGTGTEVVDSLTANTNIPASRLTAVADWHANKHPRRHMLIAIKLREVAKQIANDNRVQP